MSTGVPRETRRMAKTVNLPVFRVVVDGRTKQDGNGRYLMDMTGVCTDAEAEDLRDLVTRFIRDHHQVEIDELERIVRGELAHQEDTADG